MHSLLQIESEEISFEIVFQFMLLVKICPFVTQLRPPWTMATIGFRMTLLNGAIICRKLLEASSTSPPLFQ